jgi:hypothetical protein
LCIICCNCFLHRIPTKSSCFNSVIHSCLIQCYGWVSFIFELCLGVVFLYPKAKFSTQVLVSLQAKESGRPISCPFLIFAYFTKYCSRWSILIFLRFLIFIHLITYSYVYLTDLTSIKHMTSTKNTWPVHLWSIWPVPQLNIHAHTVIHNQYHISKFYMA